MKTRRVLAHAALLVAPAWALGRWATVTRPEALACIGLALVLGELEAASRKEVDPSRARAPGAGLALASALGLLATTWAAIGLPSVDAAPAAWLGAPLVALGIALRVMAVRALGPSFTSEIVAMPGRPLLTRGIYSRMRHPSDAGLVLVALGLAVLGASLGALLVVAVVVVPSVALRVIAEERTLAASHAVTHATYRRDVGLLLPRPRRSRAPDHSSRSKVPNASGT